MNLNLEQVEASFKELKDTLFNVIQERDTLKRERDEARFQLSVYSLNPARIGQTEIAMARTANATLADALRERDQLRKEQMEMNELRKTQVVELTQLRKVADELALGIQRNDLSPLKLYSQLPHVKQKETK